ncbi:hypothetical protein KKH36_03560 [Patescibacteria group bacterium]|nr:hypothetical protein [Patescibacteria group bacterium]
MEKIVINGVVFFDPEEWPLDEKGNLPHAALCLLGVVHQFELDFPQLKNNAEKERSLIQEKCDCSQHPQEPVMEENKQFRTCLAIGMFGEKKVFSGNKCSKCKKFFPRRQGDRLTICHRCGANMKSCGPAKRISSFEREDFKCSECGFEEPNFSEI